MNAILSETFKHGSIGLYVEGDSFYVATVYFRRKNRRTVVTTDCTDFHGFNAHVRAVSDYSVKRECLGEILHVTK